MKVLITGGTGYLGRNVVAALIARGHDLVVFARSATRSGLPGVPIDGDVRDRAALERAARGCDAVCHMAALVSIWRRRRADFDEINVGGLENVLAAANACGIPRVLYASSFLALPPRDSPEPIPANDYARTKILADRVAEARVREGGLELADQLRLPWRVPDHRHEVDVGVRDAGDALEHLEVADGEVIDAVRRRRVTGQHSRERV